VEAFRCTPRRAKRTRTGIRLRFSASSARIAPRGYRVDRTRLILDEPSGNLSARQRGHTDFSRSCRLSGFIVAPCDCFCGFVLVRHRAIFLLGVKPGRGCTTGSTRLMELGGDRRRAKINIGRRMRPWRRGLARSR